MNDHAHSSLLDQGTTRPVDAPQRLQHRAQELLKLEIQYIPNSQFRYETIVEPTDAERAIASQGSAMSAPDSLPSHLRRLCDAELLSREDEVALFRQMNYLKFCADTRRQQIDATSPDPEELGEVDSLLARASVIRNHLVQANMRLVMSIVKKFVTPQQSFDEMLSNGTMILINAVEKFDYDRGFRFSTYAYRSIARDSYRTVTAANQENSQFVRDAEAWAFEEADERASSQKEQTWSQLRELLTGLLDGLDRREKFIIRSRYALGSHHKVKTFQSLADKLGVSKERVRQLEQRAVAKLQAAAGELNLDAVVGGVIV